MTTPDSVVPAPPSGRSYLVTGAAGFIAARVCALLLEEGHRVVGIDNLNDYYDVRVKDHRLGRLLQSEAWRESRSPRHSVFSGEAGVSSASGRFRFLPIDIEDRAKLDELFQAHRFDAVLHLAGRAGVRYSLENPFAYIATNTTGTLNLLDCQRRHGVAKHVLASTSSLYAGGPLPFSEDQPVNTPLSPYAASKKGAEMLAHAYHKQFGLDVSVLRYFSVYGPAGRPDMAPLRFIKWIAEGVPLTLYGDGRQSRDFTFVDDIARGTILALREVGFATINLGGGRRPITLLDMIAIIEGRLGRGAVLNRKEASPVDMPDTAASTEKAARLLGWRAAVEPEEGFRLTCDWYLENRSWAREILLG